MTNGIGTEAGGLNSTCFNSTHYTATMAPSPSSHASSSRSPFNQNTVDYTLDHSRAHDPQKPDSAGELTIAAHSRDEAQDAIRSCAMQILEQPLELLRSGVVGDKELSAVSRSVSGSTVGKHLRQ